VAVDRTPTFRLRGRTLCHWATVAGPAPAKCSSPMVRCQVMLWCAVGALPKR